MASGRPDFHPTMLLEGKHGADLIPVLVDALGQLYTIISGNYGGVPTPVLLDADGRILAHLVGTDGAASRDVYVAPEGHLSSIIQGIEGATLHIIGVDGSGNILARMKGYDGAALRDVKVDEEGNMLAIMKGLFGATLKTIAVDTDGIMKANLSAQDLDWLTVRPVYGETRVISGAGTAVASGATTSLLSVAGKGAVLGGYLLLLDPDTQTGNALHLKIEGVEIFNQSLANINLMSILGKSQLPFYVYYWRVDAPMCGIGISSGYTFETSVELLYENTGPNTVTVPFVFYYALVP